MISKDASDVPVDTDIVARCTSLIARGIHHLWVHRQVKTKKAERESAPV